MPFRVGYFSDDEGRLPVRPGSYRTKLTKQKSSTHCVEDLV